MKYLILTIKSWNIRNAANLKEKYPVEIISNKDDLTLEILEKINPRYIFIPHWSWIIPDEIINKYECIIFHMTDLPFGRGGSPLQNLISHGIYETKISALKATNEVDAGPIYMKLPVSLCGSAEEIYMRLSKIIFNEMIPYIIEKEPDPVPQEGEIVFFKRRNQMREIFQPLEI